MTDARLLELPYHPDSTVLMEKLQHLPCPALLDSCSHNPRGGRFDILSAMPTVTLRSTAGHLQRSPADTDSNDTDSGDLFQEARRLLTDAGSGSGPKPDPEVMPFSGGLLGFLGYPRLQGHGRWRIEECFLGRYDWAINVDHKQRRSLLFFHAHCPEDTREAVLETLQNERADGDRFSLIESFVNDLPEAGYRRAFARIKDYIDAGDCYQVNLTQRFSARFSGSPWAAYRRLRQDNGKPFSAFLRWDDKALLSLSPERFLELQGRQVTTQPIKGTRPRGRTPKQTANWLRRCSPVTRTGPRT